jgi:hypothetical protein
MNPTSEEEFQSQYGIEPTMLQNLKASQEQLAAKGIRMSLEEVYEFEIGPLPETEEERVSASDPQETSEKDSYESQRIRVAQSVLQNGKASSMEEALQMVDEAI